MVRSLTFAIWEISNACFSLANEIFYTSLENSVLFNLDAKRKFVFQMGCISRIIYRFSIIRCMNVLPLEVRSISIMGFACLYLISRRAISRKFCEKGNGVWQDLIKNLVIRDVISEFFIF